MNICVLRLDFLLQLQNSDPPTRTRNQTDSEEPSGELGNNTDGPGPTSGNLVLGGICVLKNSSLCDPGAHASLRTTACMKWGFIREYWKREEHVLER